MLKRLAAVLASVLVASSLAPTGVAAQSTGQVVVAIVDYRDGSSATEVSIRLDDGRVLPVQAAQISAQQAVSFVNRRVRVDAGAMADGVITIEEATRGLESQSPVPSLVMASPQAPRFLTVPCQLIGGAQINRGDFVAAMSTDFPGADQHVRASSRNMSSYEGSIVTPTVFHMQSGSHYYSGTTTTVGTGFTSSFTRDIALANDCLDAFVASGGTVNLAEYDGVIVQHNLDIGASYAYLAPIPITRGGVAHLKRLVVNANWARAGVYAHEIGHTYGFMHTESRARQPYTSRWSVMARAGAVIANGQSYGALYSGVERTQARWNQGRVRTLAMNSELSVHLTYVTASPIINDADVLLVAVPNGTRTDTIVVEARRPVPGTFDSAVPGDAVVMHRISGSVPTVIDVDATDDPNDAGAQWIVGETYTLSDFGLSIAVVEQTPSGFVVNASFRPRPRVLGDTLRRVHEGFAVRDSFVAYGTSGTPTFSAVNLPAGLSFDPVTRRVTGTPLASGTARIRLTDGALIDSLDYRVQRVAPPWIGSTTRSYQLTSDVVLDTIAFFEGPMAGHQPVLLSALGLPTGWTLSFASRNTGFFVVVHARPSTVGTRTSQFTFWVGGVPVTRTYTFQTDVPPLVITTLGARRGPVEGEAFADTLRSVGGDGPAPVWTIVAGALPRGLSLISTSGQLSGVPMDTGTFDVTVQVSRGSMATTGSVRYVVQSALTITAAPVRPRGAVGDAYRDSLAVTARSTPAWRLVSGALPPGISLAANGVLSGTPTVRGTYSPVFEAAAGSVTRRLSGTMIVDAEALRLAGDTLRLGAQGYALHDTLRTTGGTGTPLQWRVRSGTVPVGISFTNGVFSGSTDHSGDARLEVEVRDDYYTVVRALRLRFTPSLVVSLADSVRRTGVMGSAYADTLRATTVNGTRSTWSGIMPRGLSISQDGVISGIADTSGTIRIVARVQADFPARTVTVDVPLVITLQVPPISAEQLVDHLLTGANTLSLAAVRFLDQQGNNNGRVDVGDALKWMQRQGLLSPRATASDAMEYLLRLQRHDP